MSNTRIGTSVDLPPLTPVDPLTGIVTFVMEGERRRSDPEIFTAVAQTGQLERLRGVTDPPQITGSSAGLTRADAWWAAVGETLERYAFGEIPVERIRVCRHTELAPAGRRAFSPSTWTLFAETQYPAVGFAPFREDTRLGWVEGWDLLRAEPVQAPAALVYMPYRLIEPDQGEGVVGPAVSTGAACAPNPEQAVFKGVCEILERDAFMIAWRSGVPCPRICIDRESSIHDLVERVFVRPGLEIELFLTTMDVPVPSVFGILTNRRPGAPPGVVVAGACHPNPERAVLKTLLELSQALMWTHHVGNPGFDPGPDFANIRSFDDRMRAYAFNDLGDAFEFLRSSGEAVDLSKLEREAVGREEDLSSLLALLDRAGLEAMTVDLTPGDIEACGLHVFKTLIPGCVPMEGDAQAPFLGGNRWREVPGRLGRTPRFELNPYPHPYP